MPELVRGRRVGGGGGGDTGGCRGAAGWLQELRAEQAMRGLADAATKELHSMQVRHGSCLGSLLVMHLCEKCGG